VIESSDTGQASIVFMGRDSFRMQVTDAGAIPSTLWDGGTARVIDRRKHDRRQAPRVAPVAPAAQEESPAPPMPARNTIIGIALMTFACGVMFATALNQFPLRGGSPVQAAAAAPAAQTPAVVVQPLPTPAPPPALVVAPVAPIPEVVAQPEADPQPEQPAVVAKAKPAARVVAARAVHPRRPAPSPSTQATGGAASETPPTAARPARPWVDPFAD
jgi:hypothetical protein